MDGSVVLSTDPATSSRSWGNSSDSLSLMISEVVVSMDWVATSILDSSLPKQPHLLVVLVLQLLVTLLGSFD